jgi:dolichol-phosphate mannosyltransferase
MGVARNPTGDSDPKSYFRGRPIQHAPQFYLKERSFPATLSLVIPVYNEAEVLPELKHRLTECLGHIACEAELVFVNDGSSDASLHFLMEWAMTDSRVVVLNLARNFGHQLAITAGLDYAVGDAVVVMDADLQDPPETIPTMLAEYCCGYDVVYGQRTKRKGETVFKRATAWVFYRLMRTLVHPNLPADAGDFRLISRRCLNALASMRETHRFLRGMVCWVGFPQTAVPYVRDARFAGSTKYSFSKMIRFAWTAAISFSPLPLRVSFAFGVILAAIGMTQAANALIRTALGLYTVPGWTSLMVVLCLIGSAILISIGVLGEYIARIFEENKARPLYIVADSFNLQSDKLRESRAAAASVQGS